ncbi:MAG: SOS response-associated peptidase [Actinomycetia bacterium]|nr:SOS response-associated peptidase [Actinomycetes bacterium]MCP5033479.1 SOS response-associated peptidase [Actinomycetes bacterium]
MCGRFVSASTPDELANYFGAEPPDRELEPNFNVAPTREIYVVRARSGHRQMATLTWGLVPFWAKDRRIGSKMINARSETVLNKPAFRQAIGRRRCLIPADGFYEWMKVPGNKKKQPYYIHHRDGEPLAFAGIWERWSPPEGSDETLPGGAETLETCTILTCAPNETLAAIHNRMPVLLAPNSWDEWLADTEDLSALQGLMVPAPDGVLTMRPVRPMVNSVRNNGPELLEVETMPLSAEMEAEDSDGTETLGGGPAL